MSLFSRGGSARGLNWTIFVRNNITFGLSFLAKSVARLIAFTTADRVFKRLWAADKAS